MSNKPKREVLAYAIVNNDGTITKLKTADGKVFSLDGSQPTGGSKIYKHAISAKVQSGQSSYDAYSVILLNTIEEPLAANSNLGEGTVPDSVFLKVYNEEDSAFYYGPVVNTSGDLEYIYFNNGSAGDGSTTLSDFIVVSDTVTEWGHC